MKQKITKTLLFLTLIFFSMIIFSCRKEINGLLSDKEDKLNEEVVWANTYYKNVLQPKEGNSVSNPKINQNSSSEVSSSKLVMKYPLWSLSKTGVRGEYSYVEVPLVYSNKLTRTFNIANEEIKTVNSDKDVLRASFSRLIFFKNKKGEVDQRIISYIPDKEYLAKHNGDISHNTLDMLDKDFSGFMIYRKWDESLLFMLRIENGKVVRKYESSKNSMKRAVQTKAQTCVTIDWYSVEYTCWLLNADDPNSIYCLEPPIETYLYSEELCYDDGSMDCSDPSYFGNPACNPNELTGCLNATTEQWVEDLEQMNLVRDNLSLECYADNIGMPLADLLQIFPSLFDAILDFRVTRGGSLSEIDWEGVSSFITDLVETKRNILLCIVDVETRADA